MKKLQKQFHFLSGLPRSGSTLLSSILNQNPLFYSDISNPLAIFVRSIITESFAGPGYKLQCPEEKRIELIRSLVETYYYDKDNPLCFNFNRGWSSLLEVLKVTHPSSKLILSVRDIPSILDSFEILFKKNPFSLSSLYSGDSAETVYSRCDALMTPGHTLRFAYDSLKEAITGPSKHLLFLIEYEQLTSFPEETMRALYNFIEEDYFDHDFDSVEASYDEYDEETNIKGLHTIRKKVEYIKRESIIPPDIQRKYSGLEVWR